MFDVMSMAVLECLECIRTPLHGLQNVVDFADLAVSKNTYRRPEELPKVTEAKTEKRVLRTASGSEIV